jgi:hypothetical protein
MLFTGFTFHIIKRVKYQLIAQCTVATTFLAALASCNADTLPAALAFSTIGSFPVGAMEVTPQVLIQCDSPDADIGAVYGRWILLVPLEKLLLMQKNSLPSLLPNSIWINYDSCISGDPGQ